MSDQQALPCPFCGKDAERKKDDYLVGCSDSGTCPASMQWCDPTDWNRRAPSPKADMGPCGLSEAWRCFHCDEVFTDRALAQDHFAIEGVPPMCVDPLTKDEKARMVVVRKLESEIIKLRKENEELDHQAGSFHAMTGELTRYFGQCGGGPVKTASQAFLVYEAMIGRAEAAEAEVRRLLSSTPPDPSSAARALEAVIAWGGSVKKLEEAEGLDAVLLLCAKALEISAKRSSGIAWECAEHKTFGPSYLKCAFCVPRLAALDQEQKP